MKFFFSFPSSPSLYASSKQGVRRAGGNIRQDEYFNFKKLNFIPTKKN
jgi:hypothetical protein